LDARLTTLLCKKIIVAKSKEMKARRYKSVGISRGRLWLKKGCFANGNDDDDYDDNERKSMPKKRSQEHNRLRGLSHLNDCRS
jgi:hypothetical protein